MKITTIHSQAIVTSIVIENRLGDLFKPATGETKLVKALDELLTKEGWEIPDECVAGLFRNKVDQLQEQVNSLTRLVAALSAKIEGRTKDITPTGRVDAIAAVAEAKGKGKK